MGHPASDAKEYGTYRYDPKDAIFEDKFGNPLPNSYNSDPKK